MLAPRQVPVSPRSVSTFKDVGGVGKYACFIHVVYILRTDHGRSKLLPNDGKPLNNLVVAVAVMSLPF